MTFRLKFASISNELIEKCNKNSIKVLSAILALDFIKDPFAINECNRMWPHAELSSQSMQLRFFDNENHRWHLDEKMKRRFYKSSSILWRKTQSDKMPRIVFILQEGRSHTSETGDSPSNKFRESFSSSHFETKTCLSSQPQAPASQSPAHTVGISDAAN